MLNAIKILFQTYATFLLARKSTHAYTTQLTTRFNSYIFNSKLTVLSTNNHSKTNMVQRNKKALYSTENECNDINENIHIEIPDVIENIVFRGVYCAMIKNIEQFGNPNIPLGTTDGKKCKTLRRLYKQNKLTSEEVQLLSKMGFIFESLEDVYDNADFDDILARLKAYKNKNDNFQIPKKYKADPELGAWVAMVRRLGPYGVSATTSEKLNEIGFEWKSLRKCGSSFMSQYRETRKKLEYNNDILTGQEVINNDKQLKKWLQAQKDAHGYGNLSEARINYLEQLKEFGVDWLNI